MFPKFIFCLEIDGGGNPNPTFLKWFVQYGFLTRINCQTNIYTCLRFIDKNSLLYIKYSTVTWLTQPELLVAFFNAGRIHVLSSAPHTYQNCQSLCLVGGGLYFLISF